MNKRAFLGLLAIALVGAAATTYTITDLTSNTTPSDGTLIELYDPSASPKSGKYLLTNLATVAYVNTVTNGFFPTQIALTHAGTVALTNTAYWTEASLTLTGAVTFATSDLQAGHMYTIYGRNTQATNCTPTFPAWRWMGGAPSTITALKEFTLSLSSRGTVDTNVWAAYAEAQ